MKKPVTVMRNELISMVQSLEPDAVEVLHLSVQRMLAGRKEYGDLDIDKDRRDWVEEALQECVDGNNYIAAALIKLRRSHEPR